MFGSIGGMEILVILVVALLVLGPDQLPRVLRTVGRAMGELRRASTEFQRTLNTDIAATEIAEEKRAAAAKPAPLPAEPDESADPARTERRDKPRRRLAGVRRGKKTAPRKDGPL
jgi:sec-independent protein translocase protein TatB